MPFLLDVEAYNKYLPQFTAAWFKLHLDKVPKYYSIYILTLMPWYLAMAPAVCAVVEMAQWKNVKCIGDPVNGIWIWFVN